jgi:hypothetical protein
MPIVCGLPREGTLSGFESLTAAEKNALIKRANQLLLDVLNEPRDLVQSEQSPVDGLDRPKIASAN